MKMRGPFTKGRKKNFLLSVVFPTTCQGGFFFFLLCHLMSHSQNGGGTQVMSADTPLPRAGALPTILHTGCWVSFLTCCRTETSRSPVRHLSFPRPATPVQRMGHLSVLSLPRPDVLSTRTEAGKRLAPTVSPKVWCCHQLDRRTS